MRKRRKIKMNIIRTYVPMEEKIEAISTIMAAARHPELGIYLPLSIEVYTKYFDYKLYTDVEIDEDRIPTEVYDDLMQLEDEGELYELPDVKLFHQLLEKTISKYEDYQHSFYGMLDALKVDSEGLAKNAEELLAKIGSSKEDMSLLNEVVTKLGGNE